MAKLIVGKKFCLSFKLFSRMVFFMEGNVINAWRDINPVYVEGKKWSIYDFDERFEATRGDYRSRGWLPRVPGKIISDFSNEGDMVLDQFVGGGITLLEALELNRKAIGCDINDDATYLSRELIRMTLEAKNIYVRKRDARKLYGIDSNSIDLICTQPPYHDYERFSAGLKGDMSLMPLDEYMKAMEAVARESYRVLKKGRYCVIMMGDIRKQGCIIPLGPGVANAFVSSGFKLKSVIINKRQLSEKELKDNTSPAVLREYLMLFNK